MPTSAANPLSKTEKEQKQFAILQAHIARGAFDWSELRDAINKAGAAPENWLSVRGLLQHQLNTGTIYRTSDVKVERYFSTESGLVELARQSYAGIHPALWDAIKDKGQPNWRAEGGRYTEADAFNWLKLMTAAEISDALMGKESR